MKAKDVMSTQIATVTPDTSVRDAAQRMLDRGISGMPVVGSDGTVVGMVSEGDLIRRVEVGSDRKAGSWWLRLIGTTERDAQDYVKTHSSKVADVMSHPITSVSPDAGIAEVAMLLEKKRIKRVPVVDGGKLVGLVSRADLLRALAVATPAQTVAASDESIRDTLVRHLDDQSWATGMVNVIVTDGVVNLWGIYDSEEQHEAYLVAARETSGTRGVEDHMVPSPVT